MPYPKADEPLSKLTINLYSKDLIALRVRYGRQWQEQVRNIVREYLGTSESSDEEVDL